jgi:calcineurin-like phosphoesterase family protein
MPDRSAKAARGAADEPLRYAHPFFTAIPPAERAPDFSAFGQRMADWSATKLGPIPAPRTKTSVLELSDVVGAAAVAEITAVGAIRFHVVGDTGRNNAHGAPEAVSAAMSGDYKVGDDAHNPAFFFHLGDVVYGHDKEELYRDEFYRPYLIYPGKIIAVPGNHDGEVFRDTDPVSLQAFRDNFCTKTPVLPPIASDVAIFRQTMIEPGVYFLLRAPFVDIVGLYSNLLEQQGSIVGAGNDQKQTQWLATTLATISAERKRGSHKALVFAMHHPPYSNGGHGDSPDMLRELDTACTGAGIQPDALLSGHAHNYQRYTRYIGTREIPFIVAGCGGHDLAHVDPPTGPPGKRNGDHSFDKAFNGYGYLLLTVDPKKLRIEFTALEVTRPYDAVEVTLGV